ncbi:MAG TPA: glycosyltransferase, partial [Candidatus Omnitrophica bacterium]|nr:glycosyltransferase [Candidatus Omnitrophota bacterium]
MQINVLRVVSNLGVGGVQRRLLSLLPYLNRKKFHIYICSFKDGPLRRVLTDRGYKVFIIPRRFKGDPLCIIRLIHLIKSLKIHIVHTHTHKPNTTGRTAACLAGLLISRGFTCSHPYRRGCTPVIIANEHNVDEWKGPVQIFIDRFLANLTDRIIVVSRAVQRFYESLGIRREKFHLIYNGVEIEGFNKGEMREKKRKELGIAEETCVIGTVGRLHPQKGHMFLIKAAEKLLKENSSVLFLIIGKGYLKAELIKKVDSLKLNNYFLFLGDREDIPELFSSMDIFVLASLREGFPNTVLEAMASSLPVVATEVGGISEIVIPNETGFIVPPANPSVLSHALSILVNDR